MGEIRLSLVNNVHASALDTALRAVLTDKVIGLRAYDHSQPITIFLSDDAGGPESAAAGLIAVAHDPVFLSLDRPIITADGLDTATLTLRVPKSDAAPVTLLIGGVPVPVGLTDGVGVVTLKSSDPVTLAISVQNAENRTTDQVIVTAR